jgi:hypothetical protein
LRLGKARGGSSSSPTILSSGDSIGRVIFRGHAGATSGFLQAAYIDATVDGTPGTNDMPGRLVFSTTADGASFPTERLRITSAGNVGIGTSTPTTISAGNTNLTLGPGSSGSQGSEIHMESATHSGSGNGANISYIGSDLYLVNRETGFLGLFTDGNERARIDSSGRLLIGTSSSSQATRLVLQGNSASGTDSTVAIFAAGTATPSNGQVLGYLRFSDSGHVSAADIVAARDGGTWTSGSSQPTRLVFSTTADGASFSDGAASYHVNGPSASGWCWHHLQR